MAMRRDNGWNETRWATQVKESKKDYDRLVTQFNNSHNAKNTDVFCTSQKYTVFYEVAESMIVGVLKYFDVDIDGSIQNHDDPRAGSYYSTHRYHEAVLQELESGKTHPLQKTLGQGPLKEFLYALKSIRNRSKIKVKYHDDDKVGSEDEVDDVDGDEKKPVTQKELEDLNFDRNGLDVKNHLGSVLDCMCAEVYRWKKGKTAWQRVQAWEQGLLQNMDELQAENDVLEDQNRKPEQTQEQKEATDEKIKENDVEIRKIKKEHWNVKALAKKPKAEFYKELAVLLDTQEHEKALEQNNKTLEAKLEENVKSRKRDLKEKDRKIQQLEAEVERIKANVQRSFRLGLGLGLISLPVSAALAWTGWRWVRQTVELIVAKVQLDGRFWWAKGPFAVS